MAQPLSVQLYTVRDAFGADPVAALKRLADIGFTQVEPFAIANFADQLAEALPASGLGVSSAHAGLVADDVDAHEVLAVAQRLGVPVVIDPFVAPEKWQSRDDVLATAAKLNELVAPAADLGLKVGYHNHAHELQSRIDGVTALELFAGALHEAVVLEVDTYWSEIGGESAVALLGRLGEQVQFLHIKDGPRVDDVKTQTAAGRGEMPIAEILAAAPHATPVVELDDHAGGDMFDDVTESFRYLTEELGQTAGTRAGGANGAAL
ncbi:sugar phosphate isomerase/epimerase [Schumannella sp. 10F1B-5-1]|uniref:sugar phosphate isomerase/epimerase family protein n=1 Tax=Schumannella sp. 10F1B-5-1 TaxID=2590780 RepID=UPI001131BCAC|nr:sugar phosphate isomerase/epimerase [Schumannella sp. 10F1B-5-1]TPW73419.1 sugar phosphate isomerase/epimerase [Schumannella sp. 10F1B-5-1]